MRDLLGGDSLRGTLCVRAASPSVRGSVVGGVRLGGTGEGPLGLNCVRGARIAACSCHGLPHCNRGVASF